jgi:hypothetical protein
MQRLQLTAGILIALAVGAAVAQDAPTPQQPTATSPTAAPAARGRGTPAPTRNPQTPGFVAATTALAFVWKDYPVTKKLSKRP